MLALVISCPPASHHYDVRGVEVGGKPSYLLVTYKDLG